MWHFLGAVDKNPRTLWACQPVAFMISARVAPCGRVIMSKILPPFVWRLARLLARTPFLGLAALAIFLALAAPLFVDVFPEVTFASCSVAVAPLSLVSVFVIRWISFPRELAHDDPSLCAASNAREKCPTRQLLGEDQAIRLQTGGAATFRTSRSFG